jgi:hypothetical protein
VLPKREIPSSGKSNGDMNIMTSTVDTTAADSTPIPGILPGSGDRGFWIEKYSDYVYANGVYAANDAQTDLVIPNLGADITIYAPTHMPAGRSCVETVATHWFYPNQGMTQTAHAHGFWDHCNLGHWMVLETMDAAWKSTYVRVLDGEERYYTIAGHLGSCWQGMLYNFSEGYWEQKTVPQICGYSELGFGDRGWTMWESHGLMDNTTACPVFPDIRANDIHIDTGEQWILLTPQYSSQLGPLGRCWENGTYGFNVHASNYDWEALTP